MEITSYWAGDRILPTFAENMEIALSKKGYTHKEATELLGVSKNVLSNYKKGQLPNAAILMKLAELCDVSIDWLLLGKKDRPSVIIKHEPAPPPEPVKEPPPEPVKEPEPALSPEEEKLLEAMQALPEEARTAVCALVSAMSHIDLELSFFEIPPPEPVEETAAAAAEPPALAEETAAAAAEPPEPPAPAVQMPPMPVKTNLTVPLFGLCAVGEPLDLPYTYNSVILGSVKTPYPDAALAVEVFGDSMAPEYPDGTILYIEGRQVVENGQTAILTLENAVTCKRVRLDREGRIMQLLPLSPRQETVTLTPSRAAELRVIGVVIE
jgi:SOS-response transcriptional repressor LexA